MMIPGNCENTSFQAQYLYEVKVPKKRWFKYRECELSLVEIDSVADKPFLQKLVNLWGDNTVIHTLPLKMSEGRRILGLTTQKKNFEKLNPRKILGVIQFHDNDQPYRTITRLQTNPKTKFLPQSGKFDIRYFFGRRYKEIGKTLVDVIDKKILRVYALSEAVPFYEHIGFKPFSDGAHLMIKG